MSAKLRHVDHDFAYRIRTFSGDDVNGYRFHKTSYEQN
jgi:hypothetical protein